MVPRAIRLFAPSLLAHITIFPKLDNYIVKVECILYLTFNTSKDKNEIEIKSKSSTTGLLKHPWRLGPKGVNPVYTPFVSPLLVATGPSLRSGAGNMRVSGQLAHSHSHIPTHSNSGNCSCTLSPKVRSQSSVSYEGGKTLENCPSGEGWSGWTVSQVSLEFCGFVPGCLLFIGAGLWLTSHPAPGYSPSSILFDAVPQLFSTAKTQASACIQRKVGELQRVTSENHLLVQEWKAGSRWESSWRSHSSVFFFLFKYVKYTCMWVQNKGWGKDPGVQETWKLFHINSLVTIPTSFFSYPFS